MQERHGGKIILINGASSAGKTTLALALRERLEQPFWHYSVDHFWGADVLPMARIRGGEFEWRKLRPAFFEGFHRSLAALAVPGNNLIVEHIVETGDWMAMLVDLLEGFDVFFVGLHCPLPELVRRERERGDRRIGDAAGDFATIHAHCRYDLELDATLPLERNVEALISAWQRRESPAAFESMRQGRQGAYGGEMEGRT